MQSIAPIWSPTDMRSLTHPAAAPHSPINQPRSGILSVALHLLLLLGLFGVLKKTPQIAPYKLPGTAKGVSLLTYYSPGSPAHTVSDVPTKQPTETASLSSLRPALALPRPTTAAAPATEPGTGSATQSGLGEGDIRIALQKYFPYPKPDLSALPHGTTGDVILDAVVDEHGNISHLTLVKGLSPAIDNLVIATVKQWSYTPATKNGIPVPSEQELHFHYERS